MVIRFSHSIGYEGFRNLQSEVRFNVLNLEESSLKDFSKDETSNPYSKSIQTDMNIIKENLDIIEFSKLDAIVDAIINSEKIVVAGYYHSFTFAHWLNFNLNYIIDNASLYRPETDSTLIMRLQENSVLIVFSFYRYAVDTISLAREAKEKGVKVITFTDSRVSPIAEFADLTIPIKRNHDAQFSNGTVMITIINAILYELIIRLKNSGKIQPTMKFFINNGQDHNNKRGNG